MRLLPTPLAGAYIIEPERLADERGFFAQIYCRREFAAAGLDADIAQCSVSFNAIRGTLRGMHHQAPPFAETKLVRCTQGAIYDVVLDLRPDSPSFRRWAAFELTGENRRMVYIPKGVAHGFQTLADASEVSYQISEFYASGHGCGVRWDDPAFAIEWPLPDPILSVRDRSYPDFALCDASS